jgi:hypothetical protein
VGVPNDRCHEVVERREIPAIFKAMTTINPSQSTASYDSIKLGIDTHAQYYWVSRQVDGATPLPVQKMTCNELMLFVVNPSSAVWSVG